MRLIENKFLVLSFTLILAVVLCGGVSAVKITDKGSAFYYESGHTQKNIFTWYLVKYSNNHVVWHFNTHSIYLKDGKWDTWAVIKTIIDYSKYSSRAPISMKEHVYLTSKLGNKSAKYYHNYWAHLNAYQFYKKHKLSYNSAYDDQARMVGGYE